VALCGAAALAAFTWVRTVGSGAHLLHFDAKAHLVVARRVLDSLTPGWTQLGAIWLPLPHVLNVLPSQNDVLYNTGLFAAALGYVSFVAGLAALGRAAALATGDPWAGVVALAVPALNPGWLYLQATPLIESLFLGLVGGMGLFLVRWSRHLGRADLAAAAACSGLACLVRYEAWALGAAALTLVLWTTRERWRDGGPRRPWLVALGIGLFGPVLLYGVHSWASTGIPFHVIGSESLTARSGVPLAAVRQVAGGVVGAFGLPLAFGAAGAFAWILYRRRVRASALACLATAGLAPAVVTFTAYLAGHPQKARYPLLLVTALSFALALATAPRRWAQALAIGLALSQGAAVPRPLPVLTESTRDREAVAERLPVVAALREAYTGGRILASMGSLAPVLFELRLPLREVVHEGNGNYWTYAVVDPAREVSWVVVARGDVLDQVRRYRPSFPEGFVPVMGFKGVEIYRRATDFGPREASSDPRHLDEPHEDVVVN